MVSLSIDGRILSRGSLSDAISRDPGLVAEVTEEEKETAMQEMTLESRQDADNTKAKGKLTIAEEIAEGHVNWEARESLSIKEIFVYLTKF